MKKKEKKLENVLRQAVKNGLPLSISKNLKLQMIDSGGGGILPNANCDYQTTKWKISKLPNGKYPNYQMKISKPTNYK